MKRKLLIWLLLLSMFTALSGCTKEKSKKTIKDEEPKYEQITDDTKPDKKELTICSLYEDVIMKKMINSYTSKHPEVAIHYEIMSENATESVRNDMIRTLNTEILAGNGPDVLILDNLPLTSYIEKGALMDMSDIFMNPEMKDNLLENITSSFMTEDGVYAMPVRFGFPYYAIRECDANQLKTLSDIASLCETSDRSLIAPTTYGRLIGSFLKYYSHEVINEDGTINREGLTSFLENINTIAKKTDSYPGTIAEGNTIHSFEEYALNFPDSLMWENGTMVVRNWIKCTINLEQLIAILRSMGGSYVPMNNSYVPCTIVGITSTTKNPELAKDFVSSLFDKKPQSIDIEDGGIPVNEKALLTWKRSRNANGVICYEDEEQKRHPINFGSLTDEEADQFFNYIKSLDNVAYDDQDDYTIFAEEGCGYLEGKKSLEQAVNDIINRYNLYKDE